MRAFKLSAEQLKEVLEAISSKPESVELTTEIVDQLIHGLHSEMGGSVRRMLDADMLRQEQPGVGDRDRIVPTDCRDWRAIDNAVYGLWQAYTSAVRLYVGALGRTLCAYKKLSGKDVTPKIRLDIAKLDADSTMYYAMLEAHFNVYRDVGRDNNADLHFDRMINQAVPMVERLVETKEKPNGEPRSSDRQNVPARKGNRAKRKNRKRA